MMDATYYCVLRTKAGEFTAIEHLSSRTRTCMRPVFDFARPSEKEPIEKYQNSALMAISKVWGRSLPFYVDVWRYKPSMRTAEGGEPIEHIFQCADQLGLQAMPVAGSTNIREVGYLSAVRRIASGANRSVAIRLFLEDFATRGSTAENLEETLEMIRTSPARVELLLDFESRSRSWHIAQTDNALFDVVLEAVAVARGFGLSSIVVCGTSLPESVGRRYNHKACREKRVELELWKKVCLSIPDPLIRFGDYGVVTPIQSDSGPTGRPPSRIRLSTPTELICFRAPGDAYSTLSVNVVSDDAFVTQARSWGKSAIRACARGSVCKGATEWVARDTNMHIESTARAVEDYLKAIGRYDQLQFPTPERVPVQPYLA